jgi:hypothetical protein
MAPTDTHAHARNPIGVRFPASLAAVDFAGRPAAAGYRMIHAMVRARALDAVGTLSLRVAAAVAERAG